MPAGLLSDLRIFQVAVVVRDLDAYVTRQSALLGNGPWRVYEFGPHIVQRYMMYGEPASARPLFALNDGRPQVEIIQPVCEPSIYQDWLDRRGEGLHHVAALVDSV